MQFRADLNSAWSIPKNDHVATTFLSRYLITSEALPRCGIGTTYHRAIYRATTDLLPKLPSYYLLTTYLRTWHERLTIRLTTNKHFANNLLSTFVAITYHLRPTYLPTYQPTYLLTIHRLHTIHPNHYLLPGPACYLLSSSPTRHVLLTTSLYMLLASTTCDYLRLPLTTHYYPLPTLTTTTWQPKDGRGCGQGHGRACG